MSGRFINLCFHGVGTPGRELEPGEDIYWISTAFFTEILDFAASRPDVAISFDDGNACDVEIALPLLVERRMRAAFFPVASRIGRPGSVDEAGLRQLVDAGMTIGTHGLAHRAWRGLSDADLEAELVQARAAIAASAGVPVSAAACPLGSYDRRVLSRLRALGYRPVFTSDRAPARPAAWLQSRYSVRNTDDLAAVRALFSDRLDVRSRMLSTLRTTAKRWR